MQRAKAQHAQLIISLVQLMGRPLLKNGQFGLVWMKSWDCLYENCDDVGSMIQRCQGELRGFQCSSIFKGEL